MTFKDDVSIPASSEGEPAHSANPKTDGEPPTFLRTLRWHHTLIFAFSAAGGLFISMGYSYVGLGVLGAGILWGLSSLIGGLQAFIFSELAAMFPNKAGGVAMYSHEAFKKYFAPIGVLAAFGYWFGWSITLSITGLTVGSLIEATWLPGLAWRADLGFIHLSSGAIIGALLIVLVWLFNVTGIKTAVWFGYLTGTLLIVPIVAAGVGFFMSDWHATNLVWQIPPLSSFDGWKVILVWLFVMGWTSYGAELCAAFAPEYVNRRESTKALRASAVLGLSVYLVLPLGLGGMQSVSDIAEDPSGFYAGAYEQLFDSSAMGKFVIACLIGNLVLGMNAGTAAAGRSLYALARDGMTIKQFGELSPRGVPARAMTLDMVVNLLLLFTLASPVAIILAANLGYMLAMTLGLAAVLVLRRDRPAWPRPIRLGRPWIVLTWVLLIFNALLIAFGVAFPSDTGYGGYSSVGVGVSVLLISLALWVFRRIVQDRRPLTLSEPDTPLPTAEEQRLFNLG
ncbi:APC family permease [Mycobacterium kyogaense]|uniref:APC family permease n=1 Tax=Mycobacterium kyogaense TaxID=2212479 RepID=UPI0013C425BE|nr:APC family permease [Mycobacterium kyogaense]